MNATTLPLENPTESQSQIAATGYVDLPKLLEILFPPECRPSVRWGRDHQHEWPNIAIGRLRFFSPEQVKAHLEAKRKGVQ